MIKGKIVRKKIKVDSLFWRGEDTPEACEVSFIQYCTTHGYLSRKYQMEYDTPFLIDTVSLKLSNNEKRNEIAIQMFERLDIVWDDYYDYMKDYDETK